MTKFYEGHGEEETPMLDVVLYVSGMARVAQIPFPKTPYRTLTEMSEEAWRDACPRCVPQGALIPVDLQAAQKFPCLCKDSCGYEFCAGEPTEMAGDGQGAGGGTRVCAECGDRLSDHQGALSTLCPECEANNAWGR